MSRIFILASMTLAAVCVCATGTIAAEGSLDACLSKGNGAVRVRSANDTCKPNETPVALATAPVRIGGCPDNYARVELTHSTLCVAVLVDAFGSRLDWNTASSFCFGFGSDQARLCRHEQIRSACLAGNTVAGDVWLGDRVGSDQALFTDSSSCEDFAGSDATSSTHNAAYCCLEWMKY